MVLPLWYRPTRVVQEKGAVKRVCVCVCTATYRYVVQLEMRVCTFDMRNYILLTYLHWPIYLTELAILYDHMIMYVGLFGHSAVVFRVFMFY